ncbi:MAG: DNA-formamidopyrimidine glycosylase family protein [Gammaproteobacteria bacterium]|jgi:formamidopyrimidine-DNA glycosylase
MPELPDVEVYRRYLNATALHQAIAHTSTEDASILSGISPQGLGRALAHRSFESTGRHGKYLLIALQRGGWLVLHFGMTGTLKYFRNGGEAPRYTRALFSFDNGFNLAYAAPRRLGSIRLVDSPKELVKSQRLGPDALDVTLDQLRKLAAGRRGAVKSWLMDQQAMAGIGNVYSDEILFQARIHPRTLVSRLDGGALKRLHATLRKVLETAIAAQAEPARMPAGFLLPHRSPGGACPRCGESLETLRSGGRTAWYCPACQGARPDRTA